MNLVERLRKGTYYSLDPYEAAEYIDELEARVKELEDALRKCDNADSFGQINTIVFVALKKEKPNGN